MLNLMFVMKTCELKYAQLLNSNNLIADWNEYLFEAKIFCSPALSTFNVIYNFENASGIRGSHELPKAWMEGVGPWTSHPALF